MHQKALPYAELPRFMAELRRRDSLSARALEYTILAAAPHQRRRSVLRSTAGRAPRRSRRAG